MPELNAFGHVFDRCASNPHYQWFFNLFRFNGFDNFPFFFATDFAKANEHFDGRVCFEAQQVFEKGLAALCAELGADRDGLGAVDCGYCLLVARREGA